MNVPIGFGETGATVVRFTAKAVEKSAAEFRPEFVLVSAGFDGFADDPGGVNRSGLGTGSYELPPVSHFHLYVTQTAWGRGLTGEYYWHRATPEGGMELPGAMYSSLPNAQALVGLNDGSDVTEIAG